MERRIELRRFLGVPANSSRAAVAKRCEELLRWLDSGDIPSDLKPWASEQRRLLQEFYESLDMERVVEGEEEAGDDTVTVVEKGSQKRTVTSSSWLSRNAIALGLAGIIVGAGVLAGVFWGAGIIPPKNAAQSEDASLEGAVDASEYIESQKGRIAELEEAVSANPRDAASLEELGNIYMNGQAWDKALSWFTRLLTVEPGNGHAILDIGTASMNLGDFAEAEKRFVQVLTLDPENVQAHYNSGFLFAFRTDAPDLVEAVKHWREVVRIAPDSMLAQVAQIHLDQFETVGSTP